MFRAYLKVRDECPHCGEALHHQQADDGPAYFVILIVGHLVLPAAVAWQVMVWPPIWLYLTVTGTVTIALSLWLLPRVKGAIVGIQWANRMHGFGSEPGGAEQGSVLHERE